MSKFKINTGIAAVSLLAGIFAGWETLLIVTVLILLFCEMNDNIKNVMIRILTFYLGFTLFSYAWELIVDGINLIPSLINDFVGLINNYLTEPINLMKLEQYLFTPVLEALSIVSQVVGYLLMFIKFSFALSVLSNKPVKENFIVKKINDFIRKLINFVNAYDVQPAAQPIIQPQTVTTNQQVMQGNVGGQNISNQ